MDKLKVTPERLQSASGELSSNGNTMYGHLTEMMSQVKSLNSTWQGEASTTYLNKFQSLQDSIDKLNRMVQEHSKDLNTIATNYSQAENTNVQSSSGLKSNIVQ